MKNAYLKTAYIFLALFSYNCKEKSPSNGLLTHLKIIRNTGDRGRTDTSSTDTGF